MFSAGSEQEMKRNLVVSTVFVIAMAASHSAQAGIVFSNTFDNGYFVPFSSSTQAGVRYGDSGWLSGFGPETYTLTQLDLGLAVYGSIFPGKTDITITFNDGDPSGLVFGPGTELYSVTIPEVPLPSTDEFGPEFFTLSIPLPNVVTSGGFNNVGWSVSVSNFDYGGLFGFQCSSSFGQIVGFYTNNASFYNGSNWSLFSFGADPNFGVANFVATIQDIPEPATASLLTIGLAMLRRRKRR